MNQRLRKTTHNELIVICRRTEDLDFLVVRKRNKEVSLLWMTHDHDANTCLVCL